MIQPDAPDTPDRSDGFDREPIFIGGVAGTGKTRLGARLREHPRLSVTRRTYLWRDFYGRFGDISRPDNRMRCVDSVLASPGVRALNLDADRLRCDFARHRPTYPILFALVHHQHALSRGRARWCDQLGLVEAFADPIFEAFPDARMIHMIGDPRMSLRCDSRPGRVGWSVGKWLTSAELAARNAGRFGSRYLVLRREEYLADEETALRTVCRFLDEPYHPPMLADSSTLDDPPVGPEPSAANARCRFIESRAHQLMASHGYHIDRERSAPGPRRNAFVRWPADRLGLAAWRRLKARAMARRAESSR